jgi:hypothetical protein
MLLMLSCWSLSIDSTTVRENVGSPDEEFVRTLLEAALGDTLDYMIGVGFLSFSYDVKHFFTFFSVPV